MAAIEVIADYACYLGENPLWHPLERRLYWTDIHEGRMFRYDPATGQHEACYRGPSVGGFTIQADGALLLFMENGAVARWQNGALEPVVKEIPAGRGYRFNDVIADPAGRVFCGTVYQNPGERPGRLYRLDTDGSIHLLLDGIGISNGFGFTPDQRGLYYTDSAARCIYRFDYDFATGELSNQRIWQRTSDETGLPDGMTVDAEGYIWSARWDGGAVYRYSPDGVEAARVAFPARKVSSVTFGGDDLSDLYVTTALHGGSRAVEGLGAGALFRARAAGQGLAEYFSRVG
jgi:D-xylonolactonase